MEQIELMLTRRQAETLQTLLELESDIVLAAIFDRLEAALLELERNPETRHVPA